jgi:hypothetical protein
LGGKEQVNLADEQLEKAIFGKVRTPKSRVRDIRVVAYKMVKLRNLSFESVVKITSWGSARPQDCKGKTSDSRNHSNYISRNNKLEVESESGDVLKEKDKILAYFQERDKRFFDAPRYKGQRDTLHMVLSAPDYVEPETVRKATRDFCKKVFSDYRYVFVLHQNEPDPKGGVKKPHCHVDIECLAINGKDRLRVNPDELQAMREHYANILESYGYEVNATPRAARGVTKKGETPEVKGMNDRVKEYKKAGIDKPVFTREKKVKPPDVDKKINQNIKARNKRVVTNFHKAAKALDDEQLERSKQLAKALLEHARSLEKGNEQSKEQGIERH